MKKTFVVQAFIISLCTLVLWSDAARAGADLEMFPKEPSPGEFFLISLKGIKDVAQVKASFEGKLYALWKEDESLESGESSWVGLLSIDRDAPTGLKDLKLITDETRELSFELRIKERTFPEQNITVAEKMVTLSPEDQERANGEAVLIRQNLNNFTSTKLWTESFVLPVQGRISGEFGVRRIYNGKPKSYHSGLDIAAASGVPVHAPTAGTVSLVGDFFYTGKSVFIDHGYGLYSAYFHLSSISIDQGSKIQSGDEIGLVGATGRSTGPHLHWGTYLLGQKADPLSLVEAIKEMSLAENHKESP